MAQRSKKIIERFFVEKAAELLGKKWCLNDQDRERPDFIVTEGEQQFGLEVCQIFKEDPNKAGSLSKEKESETQHKDGSLRKEKESKTQRAVNALRHKYEQMEGIPLTIKFVGDMCDNNMAAVLPALCKMNLSIKPLGHQDTITVDKGKGKLRVYVTRALRANWFSVNDRVGWVVLNPIDRVAEEIKKKSKKLPDYKRRTGFHDIRLLIVADRIMNSGKLSLQEYPELDLKGFHVVYFFSYPEKVQFFGRTPDTVNS